jgi:hypothetical protein
MRFKHQVWLGSVIAAVGITGTGIYFLSQAAAETEHTRQLAQAESDCADKVPATVKFIEGKNATQGARIQVTNSASHFNRRLKQCLVDVSTFEHMYSPVYVKSLVNTVDHALIFWTMAEDSRGSLRNCFGANGKQMDCAETDKQWKTLMYE